MQLPNLKPLQNKSILAQAKRQAGNGRHNNVVLIHTIGEIDTRKLYAAEGYPSLFAYCIEELRLSEAESYRRIQVARGARRFPQLLQMIESGALTLSNACIILPHLNAGNANERLKQAQHLRKRQCQELVASWAPKPLECGDSFPLQIALTLRCNRQKGSCVGSHACCVSDSGEHGCRDALLQNCVCERDYGCCGSPGGGQPADVTWDGECVNIAKTHCGLVCEDASSDPCDPNPCIGGECSAQGATYTCRCPVGYTLNGDGVTCDDSDPDASDPDASDPDASDPDASNNGACDQGSDNQAGSMTCDSNEGSAPNSGGKSIDLVNGCTPDPCQNGAQCVWEDEEARCQCAEGFTGDVCDRELVPSPTASGSSSGCRITQGTKPEATAGNALILFVLLWGWWVWRFLVVNKQCTRPGTD